MHNHEKLSLKAKVLIPTLVLFIIGVLAYSLINYRLLDSTVKSKTDATLEIFTDSLLAQIKHLDIILDETKRTLNEKHIAIAKTVADILDNTPSGLTTEKLLRIAEPLDIIELNVTNSNGIITHSNVPSLIGFDYKAFETTNTYMDLTNGTLTVISEEPRRSVLDDNEFGDINHYTGIAWKNGGFIQIGFNAGVISRLQEEINIARTIRETKIGHSGFGLVLSSGIITACPNGDLLGEDVSQADWYKAVNSGGGFAWIEIDGEKYYAGYKNEGGNTVVALVPEADFYREGSRLLFVTGTLLIISIAVIVAFVYFVLGRLLNELTQSRIAVMLSQIRPHFLYNVLVTIRQLCKHDPALAEETVVEFAEYLRGNLDSLSLTRPILFDRELRHTETYLALEKKRFGDRLTIIRDIHSRDFTLPALTFQPIVENAVRYGATKRESGGTVTIRTHETNNEYLITVTDNGNGFDPEQKKEDGRSHIGLNNVKSRLSAMCGGRLTINSVLNEGTTVTIEIPKGVPR